MQAEVSRLMRKVASEDIRTIAIALNKAGKIRFWKSAQLGTKETERERDVLYCVDIVEALGAEEMREVQKRYEKVLFQTAGRKASSLSKLI